MSYPKYNEIHSVTPSDTARIYGGRCKSLYIGNGPNGVTADISVRMPIPVASTVGAQHYGFTGGNVVTFKNIPVGTLLPVNVTQVKATGTDATSILSLH